MTIVVYIKDEEYDGVYTYYNVQRYEIDTKTGFLKINYEHGKTIFIKLREITYFRIF